MAISVKKTSLWRREVDNKPGMLAQTLQPLADAGANRSCFKIVPVEFQPTGVASVLPSLSSS